MIDFVRNLEGWSNNDIEYSQDKGNGADQVGVKGVRLMHYLDFLGLKIGALFCCICVAGGIITTLNFAPDLLQ